MILDVSKPKQRNFKPEIFDRWLNHYSGWAQVEWLCTGSYAADEAPRQGAEWKNALLKLSMSKNINKRRAAIAFL